MQIQKDEIRNRINEAALEEFLVAGYTQSSMRNIAAAAGITVGNIYSYFSSKEHLFESLLSNTVENLRSLVSIEIAADDLVSTISIGQITRAITDIFKKDRMEFLILMDGSAGSRYENIKTTLVELVCQRIHMDLVPKLHLKKADPLLSHSLAIAVIEGILTILRKSENDNERLEELLSEFLTVIFGDIHKRL